MADRTPSEVTNLSQSGHAALDWERVREALAGPVDSDYFLGTIGSDGRPHAAGVGALWFEGDMYFVSGPGTRKSRNVTKNPACTLTAKISGMDLVIEGDAERVTDQATLERLAAHYREVASWPAEVEGDGFIAPYSAPSAGPPPWSLYRVTMHTVYCIASTEPHGATRWRF